MSDELNPNHPTTRAVADQWHKIAALVMHKLGVQSAEITARDIDALNDDGLVIVAHGKRDCLQIRLVSFAEGERLAREAGGLPQ